MYEEDNESAPAVAAESGSNNMLRYVAIAVAVIYVAVSLYFIFDMHGRLEKVEADQKAAEESAATHNAAIMKKLGMSEASMQQTAQQLASKLGQTQKEVVSRTSQLAKEQEEAEQRLRTESEQKIGAVNGEIGGVKTDLSGAKTQIASTRSDLDATKSKLDHAIGDLGVQSGLIAHTRDELDYLKHKGDRNIFEFTLKKGDRPKPVSTVSLSLKKVDPKKGKFSLDVVADDRTIEKKDRTLNEPMQFYTGRDRNLFEVVVMSADKNSITGYMSTPKNLPAPGGN